MQRCNTCRHWDKDGPPTEGDPAQRRCNAERESEDGAACVNGEPMNGGILATGPLFGCVHHSPKDTSSHDTKMQGTQKP